MNHGFFDLRGDAARCEAVPEAIGKPGLVSLLKAINATSSPVMTLGCENGVFPKGKDHEGRPLLYVGSYVDVCYREHRVSTRDNILTLAKYLGEKRDPKPEGWTMFDFNIQPLQHLFNKPAFNLQLKIYCYANDEPMAWMRFNRECAEMAKVFERQDFPRP